MWRFPIACARTREGFGRKTGAGYYAYAEGAGRRQEDPAVHAVIDEASRARGIERSVFTAAEIQRRALVSMANEAVLLLADQVGLPRQ